MKIYFLTRSLYPYQKTGGGQIRLGQIDFLKRLGWNITVVMPNYDSETLITDDNIIQIPFNYNLRLASYLERVGFYEDYFDKWVDKAFKYLREKVKKEDIIFSTSGGELGMIKLGSLLKEKIGCKFLVNFHDPLDYSLVNGLKLDNKFHINREKQEYKYLKNSDLIITSSKSNQQSLENKYSDLKSKIFNNYFGYINQLNLEIYTKKSSDKLRIAYIGTMSSLQSPEILYEVYKKANDKNIEIYYVGDRSNYKPLLNISDENVKFIDSMAHDEFLKFMAENIDIGFVSLVNDYLGACVPSKIYEYINLNLPMIGALPNGDGRDIINDNNYGIACKYDDIDGLVNSIKEFTDYNYLNKIRQNIIKDRDYWSMSNRIAEVDSMLKKLVYEN